MYNIDNRWTVETLEWENISKCKNNKQNFVHTSMKTLNESETETMVNMTCVRSRATQDHRTRLYLLFLIRVETN